MSEKWKSAPIVGEQKKNKWEEAQKIEQARRVEQAPIDSGRTLTPRQRLAPTRLESALQDVGQQMGAFPTFSPTDQFGKEVFQAGLGGIQKMVGAFQPPTTQGLTKDPMGRMVESGGRGGEFGLGAMGLLSAPIAPIMNRLPFQQEIDNGLNTILEQHPLYPAGKAFAESRQIPEVVETVKDINKTGAYLAATAGIARGVGGVQRYVRNAPARGISKGMELFDEALPASAKEFTRPKDLRNMIPYMKEEIKSQGVIRGNRENSVVRQTDERVFKNIEDRIFKTREQFIERNANEVIPDFGNKVSDAVTTLRNVFTENIDLLKDTSILTEATKWQQQGSISLKQASQFLRHLNDNLRDLYKKSVAEQVSIEGAAKPIAEMEKAASSIRDIIVEKLNEVEQSGNYYRKLSEDYGSASKLRFAAERNKVSSEKPVPPILERFSERIGTSGNIYATAKPAVLFPGYFNSNRKLQSAFNKFMKHGGDIVEPRIPMPPRGYMTNHLVRVGLDRTIVHNLTDEQLFTALRQRGLDKIETPLNEYPKVKLDELVKEGRITQTQADEALGQRGAVNKQTIEELKKYKKQ